MEDIVREELLRLARLRGPEKSFCPSEVARAVASEWRPLMPLVRQIAGQEISAGRLLATQKGSEVSITTARGPIRLRQASLDSESEPSSP